MLVDKPFEVISMASVRVGGARTVVKDIRAAGTACSCPLQLGELPMLVGQPIVIDRTCFEVQHHDLVFPLSYIFSIVSTTSCRCFCIDCIYPAETISSRQPFNHQH